MHDPEATERWLATPGARRIRRDDAEYPAQLAALSDADHPSYTRWAM